MSSWVLGLVHGSFAAAADARQPRSSKRTPPTSAGPDLVVGLSYERGAYYVQFAIDGGTFRGVLDTGSPYALVSACVGARAGAGNCADFCRRYGCAPLAAGEPSGWEDNIVMFISTRAAARWRRGSLQLGTQTMRDVVFGVLGGTENLGGNAGGANFGLIRDAVSEDVALRPTFLGQTPYRSLSIDLRAPAAPKLEMFKGPLPLDAPGVRVSKLVDLRPLGAPVAYYACELEALFVDGEDILRRNDYPVTGLLPRSLADQYNVDRRAVALLDTGTTGLALPFPIFQRYNKARRRQARAQQAAAAERGRAPSTFGNVEVRLAPGDGGPGPGPRLTMQRGRVSALGNASFDIVTPIADDAGSIFYRAEMAEEDAAAAAGPGAEVVKRVQRPDVVFVGLGFFLGLRLGLDTSRNVATFQAEPSTPS